MLSFYSRSDEFSQFIHERPITFCHTFSIIIMVLLLGYTLQWNIFTNMFLLTLFIISYFNISLSTKEKEIQSFNIDFISQAP